MTFLETLHSLGFFSHPGILYHLLRGDLGQIHHLRGESGTLGADPDGRTGTGAAFRGGESP